MNSIINIHGSTSLNYFIWFSLNINFYIKLKKLNWIEDDAEIYKSFSSNWAKHNYSVVTVEMFPVQEVEANLEIASNKQETTT